MAIPCYVEMCGILKHAYEYRIITIEKITLTELMLMNAQLINLWLAKTNSCTKMA